ncbi:hypothetical protein IMG5_186780 [Ichthyophthirius multifiliis]|uniref:Copine family protein n=1 Tax=Ichthyophthirius multifiliis TaxID=5932 RepID=G0R3P3_ICHMU|nr:hypothetical protein IMG5_186780 [Ichthyophthirius multifiliis]EGR27926.1 hypothetical protein IMG5_186780 [Ichthyophthirius multifiliis]|eukprot:XP_004027271.1 hypothetical protein IMG5_186780 [Ichthyophthirius multifiliis]
MGNGIIGKKDKSKNQSNRYVDQVDKLFKEEYEEDTIEAANLALAICNRDETQNVEMHMQCENLPKMDTRGKADPVVFVYEQVGQNKQQKKNYKKNKQKRQNWILRGRTEVIPVTYNPKFLKYFVFSYNIINVQKIRLDIYDTDCFSKLDDIEKQELIGSVEFELSQVMCAPSHQITMPIINKKISKKLKNSTCTIRCNEYDVGGDKVYFHLGAQGFFTKNELFIRISNINQAKETIPVHRTENEKNKKPSIAWKPFEIPLSKLGKDDKVYIKLEVVEFDKDKGQIVIGEAEHTLAFLKDSSNKNIRITFNSLFKGQINLLKVKTIKRESFITYLVSTTQISLLAAIDFTNSNQPQNKTNSLHYFDPRNKQNESEYCLALKNLTVILQQFDHDNDIPLYGFGAKLPPFYNLVSNCFALNGNYFDPSVNGSVGAVKTYLTQVPHLQFHGPTILTEIIKIGAKYAQSEAIDQKNQKYYIMLILTDSDPNDIDSIIDELVEASCFPISYIVVGIGDYQFSKFENELKQIGKRMYEKTTKLIFEFHAKIKYTTTRIQKRPKVNNIRLYSLEN